MSDTPSIKCGTRAGWNQHMRSSEPVCDDCNRANTLYMRGYRGRKGESPVNFPRETRTDLQGTYGIGALIAESFRSAS